MSEQTYQILINEEQRDIIHSALQRLILVGYPDTEVPEELTLLEDMFKDIPEVEAGSPGILHGLCL